MIFLTYFCANTNIYSFLCRGQLSIVKRLIHPPTGISDPTWITTQSKRVSAQPQALLIPCLDEHIGNGFIIVIFTLQPGKKRILIFDSINFDAGKRRVPTIRKLLCRAKFKRKGINVRLCAHVNSLRGNVEHV